MQHPLAVKITPVQASFFLFQTQIGAGLLGVPYEMNKHAGTSGWIAILLAGLLSCLFIVIAARLLNRLPQYDLFRIAPGAKPHWFAKLAAALYALHFGFRTLIGIIISSSVIIEWVFPGWRFWWIAAVECFVLFLMAGSPLLPLARISTLISPIVPVMIIGIYSRSNRI